MVSDKATLAIMQQLAVSQALVTSSRVAREKAALKLGGFGHLSNIQLCRAITRKPLKLVP